MDEDCVFCKIIAGKLPAKVFYEDEHTLFFPNLSPIVDGHVMVIPKHHAVNMIDIEPDALKAVAESTQKVAKKVLETYNAKAFNLLMTNGKNAQQSVFHFHWHIVPRYLDDGLDLWIKQGL